nr:MAG TPA: hypothetical protein [Caudoviricetes sp.]
MVLTPPIVKHSTFCRSCTANTRAAISFGDPVISIFIQLTSEM